jgi:flagellar motor switch protein FliN/FliY
MTATLGEHLPDLNAWDDASAREPSPVLRLPSAVLRIPVSVQVVIGTARLPLSQVAELKPGATITLDEKIGAAAKLLVNGREVARGEIFVLEGDGERLGLTITEVTDDGQSSA